MRGGCARAGSTDGPSGIARRQQPIELPEDCVHQHPQLADRMIGSYPIIDGDTREHAKLLDVGATHRIRWSMIESGYNHGAVRRFLNSLLGVRQLQEYSQKFGLASSVGLVKQAAQLGAYGVSANTKGIGGFLQRGATDKRQC